MDRRFYERTTINVMGSFIIQNDQNGGREFIGVIDNISEAGVLISIDSENYEPVVGCINEGTHIVFQILDEYEMLGHTKSDIINGEVIVIRTSDKGDTKQFGCKFCRLSKELDEYIQNKKLSVYFRCLDSNRQKYSE